MNNEQQKEAPPALGNGCTSLCYATTEERAQWIAQQLTTLAKIKAVAETTWDASDQMDAIDEILSAHNVPAQPRAEKQFYDTYKFRHTNNPIRSP